MLAVAKDALADEDLPNVANRCISELSVELKCAGTTADCPSPQRVERAECVEQDPKVLVNMERPCLRRHL